MSKDSSSYQRALNLLANPRFVTLAGVILAVVLLIAFLGGPLLPFFVALILAYLLDGGVKRILRWRDSRALAVGAVYVLFLVAYLLALIGPVQLALRQALRLVRNFPEVGERLRALALEARGMLEGFLPLDQQERLIGVLGEQMQGAGQWLISFVVSAVPEATAWSVYLFLIPLLVFFFLKDKAVLLRSFARLIPKDRELVARVWAEVEEKISNYVRGKVWEIIIVGSVSTLVFFLLGFEYPSMMGLFSGLSVLIPFVGAIGLALPLFVLGYVQWGMGDQLAWLMGAYVIIQLLDGNLLAPLIFSEAVKLHPVFILLGVIIFGSLWGFWGVFFAIPLATVAKAVISALLELNEQQEG
ncbi:MAG: AI-2E family transporter [SAR324 cluster bacterium]|nr:AI-2E family transporter [SAR324 cluster bacterium]MCZ6645197.1 AI-2E family transporter [SAR324 cluster bacterium]MCZ6842063.1 AI-2E family transporter [SAR324 cluster bacterium]